jgi:hypothetical protein
MSKFSFPAKEKKIETEIQVDPGRLEAFAAGARDRRGQRPWDEHDPKFPPRHNVSVRLNDYHLEMLRYVAETLDVSQQKLLRKKLIPVIEAMAEETFSSDAPS